MEAKQIVLHLENAIQLVKVLNEMKLEEITRDHVSNFFDELRKELNAVTKINPFIFQTDENGDDFGPLFLLTQKSILDNRAFNVHAKIQLKEFLADIELELICIKLSHYRGPEYSPEKKQRILQFLGLC